MHRDTQLHIVRDAGLCASIIRPLKQEKGELLLV